MEYEIDFLPVGEESKSGDAIALRYGNLSGGRSEQTVIVVDGGFAADGSKLIDHLDKYYETDAVDIVVSTHPDRDHISGLRTLLEGVQVGQLWMHLPARHSVRAAESRGSGFSLGRYSEVVTKSLQDSSDLEDLAAKRGIEIVEPFTGVGTADGVFTVIGPDEEFYVELLDEMETVDRTAGAAASVAAAGRAVRRFLTESWWKESLTDDGETSPSNNSSVVSLLSIDGKHLLLTGDAGTPALERAAEQLDARGISAGDLRFVQVPHHGSRRNVGPMILDRLLGAIQAEEAELGTAFVSSARKGEPKHPSKRVTNAFKRRGYPVHVTQGDPRCDHSSGVQTRPGWSASVPLPLYDEFDEDED